MKTKSTKATIADIAKCAGVSPATVSRVINRPSMVKRDTVDKVVEAMTALERPIPSATFRASVSQSSNPRLIIANIPSLDNPFYGSVVNGIHSSALRNNCDVLMNVGPINSSTIDSILRMVSDNNIVGLIISNHVDDYLLDTLGKSTTIVQCGEHSETVDYPYVTIDDISASKLAVEHLISRGFRKIAIINSTPEYKYARHRQIGYTMALKDAGIPIRDDLIVQIPHINSDLAISATQQLLSLVEPPDAFFAVSDVYAIAVLRACYLEGKHVPEDVAVVGFDNLDYASTTIPSLTSVNQPKVQLGYMAAEILFEKLSNPTTPNKHVVLATELIVRESTL